MTPSQRALVGAVVFVGCGPEPTPREPVDVHLVRVGDTVYEYDESGHLVDPSFRWDGDQLTAVCPGGSPPVTPWSTTGRAASCPGEPQPGTTPWTTRWSRR